MYIGKLRHGERGGEWKNRRTRQGRLREMEIGGIFKCIERQTDRQADRERRREVKHEIHSERK